MKDRMTLADFDVIKELGQGSFGVVYLVKRKSNDKTFALKCVDKETLLRDRNFQSFFIEKEILRELNHKRIIKIFGTFQDSGKLYYLLEYVPMGNFEDYFIGKSEVIRI